MGARFTTKAPGVLVSIVKLTRCMHSKKMQLSQYLCRYLFNSIGHRQKKGALKTKYPIFIVNIKI